MYARIQDLQASKILFSGCISHSLVILRKEVDVCQNTGSSGIQNTIQWVYQSQSCDSTLPEADRYSLGPVDSTGTVGFAVIQ